MPKVTYSGREYEVTHTDAFDYYMEEINRCEKSFNKFSPTESGFSVTFFHLRKAISDMETFLVRNKK